MYFVFIARLFARTFTPSISLSLPLNHLLSLYRSHSLYLSFCILSKVMSVYVDPMRKVSIAFCSTFFYLWCGWWWWWWCCLLCYCLCWMLFVCARTSSDIPLFNRSVFKFVCFSYFIEWRIYIYTLNLSFSPYIFFCLLFFFFRCCCKRCFSLTSTK